MTQLVKVGDRVQFVVPATGHKLEGVARRLDSSHLAWSRDLPPDLAAVWVDSTDIEPTGLWTCRIEDLVVIESA